MANPVQAFINTFNSSLGGSSSAFVTFSFAITQEFEAFVPIQIQVSANLSFGAEVRFFQSGDGGNSWETRGSIARVFDTVGGGADHTKRVGFKLPTGQYLIQVMLGQGTANYTCTASLQTAWAVTSYE